MVLAEIDVDNIYVVCGYTDMRKSINGLTAIIVQQYQMRPNDRCLFLFCGRRADRMKALLWEGDGFLLLYCGCVSSSCATKHWLRTLYRKRL